MSKTGLVGLILTIVLAFSLTAFVFSKIQIEPVFMVQTSGSSALSQTGYIQPVSLFDYITAPIGRAISALNPF